MHTRSGIHLGGRQICEILNGSELCLNGMIEPSRKFPKNDREFRTLTINRGNPGTHLPARKAFLDFCKKPGEIRQETNKAI